MVKIAPLLAEAYLEENWEIINDIHHHITGVRLTRPEKEQKFEDIPDDLDIDIPSSNKEKENLPEKKKRGRPTKPKEVDSKVKKTEITDNTVQDPFEQFRVRNPKKVKGRQVKEIFDRENKPKVNLFNQGGYNELFEDERVDANPQDITLGIGRVKNRTRSEVKKIPVTCSQCKGRFEEYPDLLGGRDIEIWKCQKCCLANIPR